MVAGADVNTRLANVPIFSGCSKRELAIIARASKEVTHKERTVIARDTASHQCMGLGRECTQIARNVWLRPLMLEHPGRLWRLRLSPSIRSSLTPRTSGLVERYRACSAVYAQVTLASREHWSIRVVERSKAPKRHGPNGLVQSRYFLATMRMFGLALA